MQNYPRMNTSSNETAQQNVCRPFPSAIAQLSFSGDFGGREKVALGLYRSLLGIGQISLLYVVVEERAGKNRNENLLRYLGEETDTFRLFQTSSRFSPLLLFKLASSFKEQGVRVVHCHCYKSLAYSILMRFLRLLDAVVVYTLHGLILRDSWNSRLIKRFHALGLRMTDGVLGCSREILVSSLPDPKGIATASISNALDLPEEDFAALQASKSPAKEELAKRYQLDPEGLVVINVGRLCPQKNYPLYLELIRQELTDNPGSKTNFLIIGNGELLHELETLANLLGVRDKVVFTGFVADMDLVYRAADMLVQTSTWEGTPMCLLEARSYGLPVIAPAVGGNVDVVDSGQDGFLYPKNDIHALKCHYVSYMRSPEIRKGHGKAAFEKTGKNFNTQDWVLKHLAFYSRLTRCEVAQ